MAVTCTLSGRWGNICYSLAMLIAYAKKHGLEYYIPTEARAYNHFRNGDVSMPFHVESTGKKPINPRVYREINRSHGNPYFYEVPKMDNVSFDGYWQSFLHWGEYKDDIVKAFNFPYKMNKGVTSLSIRRGDCVNSPNFPIAPKCYYQNAVAYMQERGFNKFLVDSDDLNWCRENIKSEDFNGAEFEFSTITNEYDSYMSIMGCENNITARSTWSLTAAWLNQNPNKIVCVPTTKFQWWKGMNRDLLTGTDFIRIDFDKPTDEWSI